MKKLSILAVACAALLSSCTCSNEVKNEPQDNGKAALEVIMTRTSIRQYTDQPVEMEKVEAMLRAGMAAPTAMNAQPWHFVVINDKAKLEELAAANPRGKMLQSAPLAIVVCGDMSKTREGKAREFWIQDCSAATENILLAAHAQGLGAVWTALHPMDERIAPVCEALKLPESFIPLCTIIIGYPAEQPQPKDKWKPENVSYNEFGHSNQ
ncbi:MAG: nitroreductase family protein [Bacteroidales bacterium]|nr:nitroreductase family protein [Bacteroidales bacterium]